MKIEIEVRLTPEQIGQLEKANATARWVYNWTLTAWQARGGGDVKLQDAQSWFREYRRCNPDNFESVSSYVVQGAIAQFVKDKNSVYSRRKAGPLRLLGGADSMELLLAPSGAQIKTFERSLRIPFFGEVVTAKAIDCVLLRSVVAEKKGDSWWFVVSLLQNDEVQGNAKTRRDVRPGPAGKYGLERMGITEEQAIPEKDLPPSGRKGFLQYLANYKQRHGKKFSAAFNEDGSVTVKRLI